MPPGRVAPLYRRREWSGKFEWQFKRRDESKVNAGGREMRKVPDYRRKTGFFAAQ